MNANLKKENSSTNQSKPKSLFTQLVEEFEKYAKKCINDEKIELENNSSKHSASKLELQTLTPAKSELTNELILLCADLSFWVYAITKDGVKKSMPHPMKIFADDDEKQMNSDWYYLKTVETQGSQVVQWSLMQHKLQPKIAYLVFKGTSPDMVFGMYLCAVF